MEIKLKGKVYQVIPKPEPHIVVPTQKKLHGWWPGKRECTSERMLINPYNGCGIGCFFCYSLALPGNFQVFREKGIIIVSREFDREVARQLDSLDYASCGYLSPVTDPFQPLNRVYKLSQKIIKVFVERNIPIEFVTKARIPQEVIATIKGHPHSFGQVSILTPQEDLRKILVPRGADTLSLFENLKRLSEEKIFSVCRIDPVFPYLTDGKKDLKEIVSRAKDCGCTHIVASVLDIPLKIKDSVLEKLKIYFGAGIKWDYQKLYRENIDGYLNAKVDYRKRIFDFLRNLCERKNLTFALCMEYELKDGEPVGLNREFSNSVNCEGIDIPLYQRRGDKFYPAIACRGNCLFCTQAKCGVEELAMKGKGRSFTLADYRRWSEKKVPLLFE